MNRNIKRGLIASAVVLGLIVISFVILRYIDLLLAVPLYSWFFERIRTLAGFTDDITGAIAVWLTAALVLLIPTVIALLIWDKRKAIVVIAFVISIWFVLSFLFTQPREGYYFNPMTGTARYKF